MEGNRSKQKHSAFRALSITGCILLVIVVIILLIIHLWVTFLQVSGTSMAPTLNQGEIVAAVKTSHFQQGDIIAFRHDDSILLKRVIASEGQLINISEDGVVYVDNEALDEPYLGDQALGDCNIDFPYQVPDSCYFVMGDHRSVSIDSRNSTIGCVSKEQIVGKAAFRIWPFAEWGAVGRDE